MTKQINYKKEFIEFLRERDLITSFCAGLAHPKWKDNEKLALSLTKYLNNNLTGKMFNDAETWISLAFLWKAHTKNHDFWETIDGEWRVKLNDLQN